MMLNSAEIVDDTMVVEGYEEIAVDDDMNDMGMTNEDKYAIQYEVHDDQAYGGMPVEMYNDIIRFKRDNIIPEGMDRRADRSAPSHWRARCKCFTIADDGETLLYFNPENANNPVPKVVVKKGEVRRVLERIHELIGHLGQKRTQMVVLRKLYWRSVRQDVKTFISSCDFCNEKKAQGKKITKSPVDITSEAFDIGVRCRLNGEGERLVFQLFGYTEAEVLNQATTRMTSYTFKETAVQYRSRYASQQQQGPPAFRRQPYVKKHNNQNMGYLLPFQQRSSTMEPEFIQVMPGDVYGHHQMIYDSMDTELDETILRDRAAVEKPKNTTEEMDAQLVSLMGTELLHKNFKQEEEVKFQNVMETPTPGRRANASSSSASNSAQKIEFRHHDNPNGTQSAQRYASRYAQKRHLAEEMERGQYGAGRLIRGSPAPTTTASLVKKRRRGEFASIRGMANRFSLAIGESDRIDNAEVSRSNPHLIEYPEQTSSILRGDSIGLPPVIMAPSTNDEVCKLQIEALQRHIHMQKMQEKILHESYEASLRIPITRYIQQEEEEEGVQGEQLEVEHDHELNVIDHEVYEEVVEEEEVPQQAPNARGRHIHHQ